MKAVEKSFGEFLREIRLKREYSLRKLAKELKMDIGNLSKIENGKLKPPMKEQFIEDISEILELEKSDVEMLIDMASHENGEYPRDIKESLQESNYIPVLLRTISNKKLSDEQIRELTNKLNQ
jgi:transcriptional regulator with XRE-family HTH domain